MPNQNFSIIKDANGKEFSIDISKIADIDGDLSENAVIQDRVLKNRITFDHDTKICDSQGKELDSIQVLKDMESGSLSVVAADIEVEATHSGKNHNFAIYYEDSMDKDAESFLNPFHKPMLKNHDSYSEPLGRVLKSEMGPSALTDERSAIHLKVRVTDQDAIPKFIDKRYGTVSIGGSVGTMTCNICGKTLLKDGKFKFCGHMRGETYRDQICYWGARDIEYKEVSVVNHPADDFAQITKVTILTDKDLQKDNNDNKEESQMHGTDNEQETNIDNLIDNTLGTEESVNDSEQIENKEDIEHQVEDNTEENKTEDATQPENDVQNDAQQPEESKTEDSEENKESEAEDSEEENATDNEVDQKLAAAEQKIKDLEEELLDAQSQVDVLKKELEDNKTEIANYKDRCIALATANKEYVVDGIMSNETFKDEEAKDARKKDLMIKSMKELKSIKAEAKTVRDLAHVDNPTLADDSTSAKSTIESNSGNTDTEINDNANSKKARTVNDAVQQVISILPN